MNPTKNMKDFPINLRFVNEVNRNTSHSIMQFHIMGPVIKNYLIHATDSCFEFQINYFKLKIGAYSMINEVDCDFCVVYEIIASG